MYFMAFISQDQARWCTEAKNGHMSSRQFLHCVVSKDDKTVVVLFVCGIDMVTQLKGILQQYFCAMVFCLLLFLLSFLLST